MWDVRKDKEQKHDEHQESKRDGNALDREPSFRNVPSAFGRKKGIAAPSRITETGKIVETMHQPTASAGR